MTLALAFLTVLAGQLFVVSRGWLGSFAPDLMVPLAAYLALYGRRRSALIGIVLLGWVRALVLVEPVGGQVLAALLACAIVSGLRPHLLEFREFGFVLAAFILAGCWSMAAFLTSHAFGVTVIGGRELVLGSLFSVPLAGLASRLARRHGAYA